MSDNVKKELYIDTFNAVTKRYQLDGCILHSDRGSQCTSESYRETLSKAGVDQSLSEVEHRYDNSRMESSFATLKKELLYRIPTYRMKRENVKSIIFRYVFTYYNQKRIYTANPGSYPPAVYRLLQEETLLAA